jgi:hypothetical protein
MEHAIVRRQEYAVTRARTGERGWPRRHSSRMVACSPDLNCFYIRAGCTTTISASHAPRFGGVYVDDGNSRLDHAFGRMIDDLAQKTRVALRVAFRAKGATSFMFDDRGGVEPEIARSWRSPGARRNCENRLRTSVCASSYLISRDLR